MRTHPELRDFPISGIGGIETGRMRRSFYCSAQQRYRSPPDYAVRVSDSGRYGERVVALSADQGFDSLQEMVGLANNNIVQRKI